MIVYTQNGVELPRGQPFELTKDGATFAMQANFFDTASADDLTSWGIVAETRPDPAGPSLDETKRALVLQIDSQAEMARLRFITPGSGQALEYREAAEEAARYDATGGQGSYPMLQASVDAGEAANLGAAAALVSQREAAWAAIGAEIRRLRIKAKRDVAAASDATAARAAAQVTWPAP